MDEPTVPKTWENILKNKFTVALTHTKFIHITAPKFSLFIIMKTIALFGLSADPPTGRSGHLGILLHLLNLHFFDEIWIIPVYTHVFANKKNLQPFEHRVAMCKLNFEKYSSSEVPVVVKELEREICESSLQTSTTSSSSGRVGTIDLIRHIKSIEPDINIHLVLGSDTFSDLVQGKWKESVAVLNEVSFEVFSRQGVSADLQELLQETNRSQYIRIHNSATLDNVSSTAIRAALSARPVPDDLSAVRLGLEPAVFDYIKSNHLYERLITDASPSTVTTTATVPANDSKI